jgi:hypothetical protein
MPAPFIINVRFVGSKIPRLPGDHFQYVLFRRVGTSRRWLGGLLRAGKAEVFSPLLPNQSGFQPTAEPTAFQAVVV